MRPMKIAAMFVTDHFYSQWAEGVEPGSRNAVTFAAELDRLGLKPELFTGSHSKAVRSSAQFEEAVTNAYGRCAGDRAICR